MAIDVLILLTWTTWNRAPLIDAPVADHLRHLLPLLAVKAGGQMHELSIVPTHVHAVVELRAKYDIPTLAQALKGTTARLVNQSAGGRIALRWANGYDARSVGRRQLDVIRRYLDRQDTHHNEPLLARWSSASSAGVLQDAPHAERGLQPADYRASRRTAL